MCCTGQCPYEDHAGECCVSGSKYPDDAFCVLTKYGEETKDAFTEAYHFSLSDYRAMEEVPLKHTISDGG